MERRNWRHFPLSFLLCNGETLAKSSKALLPSASLKSIYGSPRISIPNQVFYGVLRLHLRLPDSLSSLLTFEKDSWLFFGRYCFGSVALFLVTHYVGELALLGYIQPPQ